MQLSQPAAASSSALQQSPLLRATSNSSGAPGPDQHVQQCLEKYNKLLSKQRDAAAELQTLLQGNSSKIGLIENSYCRVHSFNAAITEAKNPGYFSYYKSPKHIVEQEHSSELQARIAAVTALDAEMQAARQELEAARESARQAKLDRVRAPQAASSSLSAWFEEYGRPAAEAGGAGYRTTFKSSTKLHGGTKHYPAFKSSATSMQVGRMLK